MNPQRVFINIFLLSILISGCEKNSLDFKNIDSVGLKVSFTEKKSSPLLKNLNELSYETPLNYFVSLKSAKLIGINGTADAELFNETDLSSSFVFDYTDDNTVHSLLNETEVPTGEYTSIEIEIYFLQMNIAIATEDRGIERRNFRIYLSDDAETEGGVHQPGDICQINDGQETGWLMGNDQGNNMDPVTPREAAYAIEGEDNAWLDFAGKPGSDYGPFGNIDFMNNAPHPIYKANVDFNFSGGSGGQMILDFNVANCWMFEDKSGDGVFGIDDLEEDNPTDWNMALPLMTVTLQ